MKSWFSRTISLALIFAMLFQLLPMSALAADAQPDTEQIYEDILITTPEDPTLGDSAVESFDADDVMWEDTSLREENIKHFRMSDGSYIAVDYGYAVHYKDENGIYQEIDNRLFAPDVEGGGDEVVATIGTGAAVSNYEANNRSARISFAGATASNIALITIGSGDTAISMTPYASVSSGPIVEDNVGNLVAPDGTGDETEEVAPPAEDDVPAVDENVPAVDENVSAVDADVPAIDEDVPAIDEDVPTVDEDVPSVDEDVPAVDEDVPAVDEDVPATDVDMPAAEETGFATVENEAVDTSASDSVANIETLPPIQMNEVAAIVQNSVTKPEEKVTLHDAIMPEHSQSEVLYSNIFPNVDLEYILIGNDVKENIIIKSAMDSYAFPFLLEVGGDMTLEAQADGSVNVLDGDEIVYRIAAPYMFDAAGETSMAVSYEFAMVKPGIYLFVTDADAEWINAEDRVFPVTVDPSLSFSPLHSDTTATYIFSRYPTQDYSSIGTLTIGSDTSGYDYRYRSLWKINTLPALPENSTVVDAELHFTYNFIPVAQYELDVVACELGADASSFWTGAKTWNNCPTIGSMLDHAEVLSSATTFYLDITRAYVKWHNDSTTNNGVIIKAAFEDELSATKGARIDALKNNNVPTLLINYRNTVGLESYYTYQSHSIGRAGTGYVGDYSGGLTIVKQDTSAASTVMPVTVSHVYNSAYSDKEFSEVANTFTAMKLGVGWQLSAMEAVYAGDYGPVYVDGDGTEHYFIWNSSSQQYEDEDGFGLTMTVNGTSYTISDRYGGIKTFRLNMLSTVVDANGNATYYNYNTSNQLTSITRLIKGGSTETIASFTYDSSNYLTKITDYSGNITTFAYSTISGVKYLSTITHPDNTTVTYSYSGGKLTVAKDNESGYSMNYTYSGMGKVSSFTEKAGTTSGAKIIAKGTSDGLQAYCYVGADRKVSTNDYFNEDAARTCSCASETTCTCDHDNIHTYMVFDYFGRTINTYSTNYNMSVLYGVDSAQYQTNSGTNKQNNKLLSSSIVGTQPENFVPNSGFESGTTGWTLSNAALSSVESHTGVNSVALSRTSSGTAYITRSITGLEEGDYILSAYVNTSDAVFSTSGGVYVGSGQKVNYATEDGEWARVSYVASASSTGSLTFRVYASGMTGTIYVDDLQLERRITSAGTEPSNVNLINDGDMSGDGAWNLTNAVYSNGKLKMNAGPTTTSYATQLVPVNMPGTQTYLYSAWAQAESGPLDRTDNFALKAIIKYSDNTTEAHLESFSRDYSGMQYLALPIVPKEPDKTVVSITLYLNYNYNLNTAYFDKVALVREEAASYTYNSNGDLTGVTATDSEQQSYSYSGADLISQTTMGNGNYTYGYDTKHNVTSVTNDGVNMAMTYDTAGNVLNSVLTGTGTTAKITSSATYTNGNNLLATSTDSRGNATTYAYSSAIYKQLNIPSAVTDARGIKQVTTLNTANGRTTMNYISGVASVDYAYSGGILSTINRGGYLPGNTSTKYTQTYTMGYNAFDQLTSVKVGTTTLATYAYAANDGLLSSMTYGNGDVVSYTYDELERISSVVYDDGTTITYTYNGLGALGKLTDSRGRTYLYNYDSLGRLISMSEYKGSYIVQNMSTEYDTSNRVSTLTYKVDPNLGGTLESNRSYGYTYDDTDGTLTKLTGPGGRLAYSYDGLKRLQYKNTYNAASGGSVTVGRQYGYLAGSGTNVSSTLVGSLILKNGSSIYSSATYDYDEVGNITSITDSYLGNRSYTYDTLGQMTKEVIGNTTYNYTYDTYGNIRSKTTTSGTTANFTYGTSGWLDKLLSYNGNSISYDAIGNPTVWHDGSAFTWTNGKQLTAATAADGTVLSYSYDADGLRLTKVVDGVTHNYLWQGDRLVSEQYGTTELEFFYDESGVPYALDYNGTIYYYITNLQGDVIGIVDASGTIKAKYKYNAWGEDIDTTAAVSSIETINPLRYRGYYYDSETGLYYLQSRYYDPVVCRFINADEFAATGQGFLGYNMFAYCGNSPVANKDESGTFAVSLLIGVAAGAIVGAVAGGFSAAAKGESVAVGIFTGAITGGGAGLVSGIVTGGMAITAATVVVGSLAVGLISATGEALNQVGNIICGNSERMDGGKILKSGIIGTLLAPLSFGGGKLIDVAFRSVSERGADAVARGIVESVINGINSTINGMSLAIA